MKTHSNKVFSVAEELSSQGDSEVSCVSTFLVLHFAGEDEHLSSRVLNLQLNKTGSTYLRIVAASEVTKVLSMWFTTIFLRPELFKKF
jgi:hypothetical protein